MNQVVIPALVIIKIENETEFVQHTSRCIRVHDFAVNQMPVTV